MRKAHEFFIMKSIIMSLAAGGLAMISLAGCGKSIELENVGAIPDLGVLGLAVRGDLVYAITEYDALVIVDISTPEEPEVVGRFRNEFPVSHSQADIALSGDRAYFVVREILMSIVDISQPSQPVELGRYQAPGTILDIVVREPYAYLVGPGLPVLIVDISAPDAPVLVGEVETPGAAYALALSGDYAFVADRQSGLFVADISDPTAPRAVGINADPSGAMDIAIRDDHAYLSLELSGLATMNISDPEATLLTDFEPVYAVDRLAIGEDVAYVTKPASVVTVDLSDPDDPQTAGEYVFPNTALWINSIVVSADYVVVGRQRGPSVDPMDGDLAVLRRKN
jgi:hypothetical protein